MANPFFAYGAILALQLRVLWNVWKYRDTTPGDTSNYFLLALQWAHHLTDNMAWSPLYTDYFGTILWFVHDVPSAVMVHRLLLVFGATVLVLALGRALLGPALGLLLAVWWAVDPANFDFDYEVHLFGFIPVLVAAFLLTRSQSRVARGVALAILVGTTFLIRNELVIVAVIFALAIVISEVRQHRVEPTSFGTYLRAYGVPLLIVCLVTVGAVWQSPGHGRDALAGIRAKERLNICQAYAFNFQQRHPQEFTGNPFTECTPLMQRFFGRPMPTLAQEIRANPRAIAAFVNWNVQLAPSGLQVALFGATSTGHNPGYTHVKKHRQYALVLSLLVLTVVGAGLAVLARARGYPMEALRQQKWALMLLGTTVAATIYVALTQRPRPEYISPLTLGLMMLTALCVGALIWRVGGMRFIALTASIVTLALIIAVPSYYKAPGSRIIHDALDRLQVVRPELQRPGAVLVTSGYNWEICAYLAKSSQRHCASPSWADLRSKMSRGTPVGRVLDDVKATVIYADPALRADPAFAAFQALSQAAAWRTVASGTGSDGDWSILIRRKRVTT